ncbi:hypothetical protein [Hyphomicrobium sp. 2TAF46]|uniref:hypothetical protein n=1 Tax=Hyphomicrobium sp. 2TAF46 TaxID=3233019 RepID=UPI003F8EC406
MKKYESVSECIYCGADTYSTKPNIRRHPLGGEHIIPEGIGGTLELPQASCQEHEDITGRMVEGDVLGRTMKALRVFLRLKKPGSGPHPNKLPLETTVDGRPTIVQVDIDDYPIVFSMPNYTPSSFTAENDGPGRAFEGMSVAILRHDQALLLKKYNVSNFATAYWDNQMLCRMLAKIGHAFAAAELGSAKFRPILLDLICRGDTKSMSLIGGEPVQTIAPKSSSLHEIELGYQRSNGKTYVVSRIRLFARYGGPRYYVVVGESLETPIARARRVFSSKISRIPFL